MKEFWSVIYFRLKFYVVVTQIKYQNTENFFQDQLAATWKRNFRSLLIYLAPENDQSTSFEAAQKNNR